MKVISLVNGSLTSHTTAIYALHYAKKLEFDFLMVYIKTSLGVEEVQDTIEDISDLSTSYNINCEFEVFENLTEFRQFVYEKDIDMIFCSTKHNKTIYDKSFVTKLLSLDIKSDLSVVKVVKIGRAYNIDKIILPIRGSKLSVKKFTLFSTFSQAYESKAQIYSVDKVSKINFSYKSVENIKQKLQEIIFNLRHYFRLSKMIDFKFSIKHQFSFSEGESVQTHIAQHGYDLIIMGGHHEKNFWIKHPIDILFDKPLINTIYFIPYNKDEL